MSWFKWNTIFLLQFLLLKLREHTLLVIRTKDAFLGYLTKLGPVLFGIKQLDWTELNWSELNWNELIWTELNKTELKWIVICESKSIVKSWTELNWIDLNWTELNWTELNWTELNWIELNWTELNLHYNYFCKYPKLKTFIVYTVCTFSYIFYLNYITFNRWPFWVLNRFLDISWCLYCVSSGIYLEDINYLLCCWMFFGYHPR